MSDPDLESLHAALDLDPSDQFTRRVLADLYDERGDDVMASGLRWMAGQDKYPMGDHIHDWRWLSHTHLFPPPEHHLPDRRMTGGLRSVYWSRRAAEEDLCRALAREGVSA